MVADIHEKEEDGDDDNSANVLLRKKSVTGLPGIKAGQGYMGNPVDFWCYQGKKCKIRRGSRCSWED